MRLILADDASLLREGLARLLTEAGVDVVAQAADGESLLTEVGRHHPDAAVVDIRMPPTFTSEGLDAARRIRAEFPDVAVMILSQHVDSPYASQLLASDQQGVGYLLKDRVVDIDEFVAALRHLCEGGTVVDRTLVDELLRTTRIQQPLATLTAREHEVLGLMAEGRTDRASRPRCSSRRRPSRPTWAASCASSTYRATRAATSGCTPSWPSWAPAIAAGSRDSPDAGAEASRHTDDNNRAGTTEA